jgi:hypothetical protein
MNPNSRFVDLQTFVEGGSAKEQKEVSDFPLHENFQFSSVKRMNRFFIPSQQFRFWVFFFHLSIWLNSCSKIKLFDFEVYN